MHPDDSIVWHESLLTLAYYFDCGAMMHQFEIVMLTKVQWAVLELDDRRQWLEEEFILGLTWADRYRLRQWRLACILVIARVEDREN